MKDIVAIRRKKLKDGSFSLYLDYFYKGKREYEFLRLYILPGKDAMTRQRNANTEAAARIAQANKVMELQSAGRDLVSLELRNIRMSDYIDILIRRKDNGEHQSLVNSMSRVKDVWVAFAGDKVKVCDVDVTMLRRFLAHISGLNNEYRVSAEYRDRVLKLHSEGLSGRAIAAATGYSRKKVNQIVSGVEKAVPRPYSERTTLTYFNQISTILNRAVKDGILPYNPAGRLDASERPKKKEGTRAYLTTEELRRVVDTPCGNDMVKRMFLFSCFTGLRFSDVSLLTWAQVEEDRIYTVQKKTQRTVVVPMSDNARHWLPERKGAGRNDRVFAGHLSKDNVNRHIRKMVADAGIAKDITFHCARHTFATLLITYDTDIYVVSSLLGHTSISTTQIYAKIIDRKKTEAVNRLPVMDAEKK